MNEPGPPAPSSDDTARGQAAHARGALASLAETLSLDGYRLEVAVPAPATARLEVRAGTDACADCLVPEPVLAGIAADALGPGWAVEVHYPGGER